MSSKEGTKSLTSCSTMKELMTTEAWNVYLRVLSGRLNFHYLWCKEKRELGESKRIYLQVLAGVVLHLHDYVLGLLLSVYTLVENFDDPYGGEIARVLVDRLSLPISEEV